MSEYKKKLKALLIDYFEKGKFWKFELERLASELELIPIYNAYKDRDPFDTNVAIALLSQLLDKECVVTFL